VTTPPPSPSRGDRLFETILLVVLGGVLGLALVLDAIGALAATLTGGGWVWTPPGAMFDVLSRSAGHVDDPRQAWPPATRERLPGPVAMYVTAALVLAVPTVAACWWLRRRGSASNSTAARWATPRDLHPLRGDGSRGGRLPLGSAYRRRLTAEPRQSVLVVAPTQSGKTTALAIPAILDWPGPVVATSVKTDLVRDTLGYRSARGRTQVFDPTGTTGLPGSASWTPLANCRTWQGARRTAAWMTDAAAPNRRGLNDGDFWYSAAGKLLAPLLYAAATSGCTMEQVLRWLDKQEESEVLAALEYAGCADALSAMEATWARDERQRSSVYTTAETVVDAYADPGVLASSIRPEIRAADFLDGTSRTIYLCATARNQRRLRPVFVTLLQEILEEAYARSSISARPLDPPLLIALDEAANIAPLPDLDVIAATGAGQGVQLLTVLQDLAQAYDRWGRERADTIINNHRARIFGAGLSDERTLSVVGRLLGEAEVEQRSSTSGEGRGSTTRSTSWRSLAPPNLLREAAAHSAVLVYGTLPPAVVRLRPWFKQRRLNRLVEAHRETGSSQGAEFLRMTR
jgi:type IV secretion system protein VirD4